MKKLVRGSWKSSAGEPDWEKLSEGLLMHRNTPSYDGRSPAQVVFGHAVRDTLTAHRRTFAKEWQQALDEVEARAALKREKVEKHYNASAKELPRLKVTDRVAVQDAQTRKWDRYGVIVEAMRHNDFLVKLTSGRVLRRNRRFLVRRLPVFVEKRQREQPPGAELPVTTPGVQERRPQRTRRPPDRIQVDPSNKSYA